VIPRDEERTRALALLRAHGWNATSFQVLEPGFRYWFDGEDACVGYVDTGRAWVVAGAPIAPHDRLAEVARSFVALAAENGKRVAFFGTEARFPERSRWPALRIGDQPVWNPGDWNRTLASSRSLREQLRRARAKEVRVRSLDPSELALGHALRDRLDALIARWLHTRPMAPMGFLVQVHPYTFAEERRCFAAERGDALVGFLGVIPIYARGGWFFEDFLSDPAAPNGTIEMLIDAGMREAAGSGIPYVTLGLVPLAGEVAAPLRVARRWGAALYDFNGLQAFKSKFKPRAWDPIYLAYPPGRSALGAIYDTLSAFSRGDLLAFGVQTLARGPAIILRALAILLAPWTLLLALPVSRAWFPSETWRWGWVAFDVVVGVALLALSRRWNQRLAMALLGAVALDAVLTLIQAVVYDWPRFRTPLDRLVMLAAVLAPAAAATLLWLGRVHRGSAPVPDGAGG
jgi:phosphatidylglycerol lysyltransferase